MTVRMREVAALAGVSSATVSRVLTGTRGVRRDSRERVLAAIDQLGYHPNSQARGLRTRSSDLLGLIVPDITNPFFTSIARGLEDCAQQEGFSVVLANSDDSVAKERRCLEVAISQQLAGVVIAVASAVESRLDPLLERGIPVVTVDQRLRGGRGAAGGAVSGGAVSGGSAVDSVSIDNRAVAARATRAMLEAGRRRIGVVTGPRGLSTGSDRLAGYHDALRAKGIERSAELVERADFHQAGGYKATRELLDRVRDLDGLLVANNLMTLGALDALQEQGIAVPERVMVAGFDELPWSSGVLRRIDVVRQPAYDIGRTAGELLVRRVRGDATEPEHVVLKAQLLQGSDRPAR